MRRPAFIVLVALAVLAAASCNKDTPTNPSTQGLAGTWRATSAIYQSVANSSKRVDIVSQGSTVVLELATSTFTLTITDPGKSPKVTTGSWTSTTDTMTLSPSGASFSWVFSMAQSRSGLTLSGAHVQFDFGGGLEESTLTLALTR